MKAEKAITGRMISSLTLCWDTWGPPSPLTSQAIDINNLTNLV